MTNKARLTSMVAQLSKEKAPVSGAVPGELVANKPHGEKADHIKITVTLPPEVYKLIADEAARRKMNKEPNPQLSAIIREAVVVALEKK